MTAIGEEKGASGTRLGGGIGVGAALFALALAGGGALFWKGSESLLAAWTLPEYSHGPLIPILSFYLFLRQLRAAPAAPAAPTGRWTGVALAVAAVAVAMIGNLAAIPDIVTYSLIVWCYALLLVGFGWSYGKQFWPPVLHLVFMLPLPAFIYWQVSINLQFVSSEIGVAVIRAMGIPVFLDGNIIDLGVYKLQVAEACSGLRYLFPVMSFTYIFAVLYQGPVWIKAVLLLSAMPITVLMNSFRIGMIGVLVDNFGIAQAEGFLHYFEGWVIFLSCVLILFGMARGMQLLVGDRRPLSEALDLDFAGLGPQAARIVSIRASGALALAAALTAGAGAVWHLTPERAAQKPERALLVLFPRQVGDWTAGPAQTLDPDIARVLAADDYVSVGFASPGAAAPVDFFVAYYNRQTEGSGIHSPAVCIPAGGWEMSRIVRTEVETPAGAAPVNRAVIQKGLSRQLVYYWFEQRGRRMTSDYAAKVATVFDALARGRTDGALVRIVTPILPGEPDAAADARLTAFLGAALPQLARFVPE